MMDRPENLTIHPEAGVDGSASGDLLSHALAHIRLRGDHVRARALAAGEQLERTIGAGHVCVVTEGTAHVEGDAHARIAVETGDMVMLTAAAGGLRVVASGAPASITVFRFWLEPDSLNGMIFALPQCIHIRRAENAEWLNGLVHYTLLEAETMRPGSALMISRIIDLMVIRTLRWWVHQGQTSGWLGGLSDMRIARALKAIHEQPMQPWSIEALAGICGMSRSSFCERFAALVGHAPLRYQNELRLTLAREMLAKPNARVGEIGLSVGYKSEAAFSRAYKALFGHPPRQAQTP
ncbi:MULTISPECIES: AraC family transcriptional regulator [Rhodomicrobium]|uniref:AraC family transcriptional regulator n=1 Tax=Rhodomicrobium TaxID=1068 RepID=UPI000B4B60D6|nr:MULTISPECIES: AraC family transcriptional regulator [Rhodomicrobium]